VGYALLASRPITSRAAGITATAQDHQGPFVLSLVSFYGNYGCHPSRSSLLLLYLHGFFKTLRTLKENIFIVNIDKLIKLKKNYYDFQAF
jgi:hypothetical protein